jgi:quercetin dioxygenase-like cupin family protein
VKPVAAVFLLVISVFASPPLPLNREPETNQETVPVANEPRHHFKFENRFVRIFDVVVPPQDTTLYHLHAHDYLFVMIGAATLKAQLLGEQPFDLIVKDGEVRYSKAPLTHRVTNVGKVDFRNITIEVLDSPGSFGVAMPLEKVPGHSLILENDRARVERLVLEPGQTTGMHSHNMSELAVAITAGHLQDESSGEKPRTADAKPGDFRWHDGRRAHSLKNIGNSRFEAVTIEWK